MSYRGIDDYIDKLGKDMQECMKSVIKEEIYDKPDSKHYVRTGDMLNAIQLKTEKSSDGLRLNYKIKVYYDTSLIRPMISSDPAKFNHHMSRGTVATARDVSSYLPKWYDKGFIRNGRFVQADFIKKTKEKFVAEKARDIIGKELKETAFKSFVKYKK